MFNDPVASNGGDMPRIDQLRLNDYPTRTRPEGFNKGPLVDLPLPSSWAAPRDPLTSTGTGIKSFAFRNGL